MCVLPNSIRPLASFCTNNRSVFSLGKANPKPLISYCHFHTKAPSCSQLGLDPQFKKERGVPLPWTLASLHPSRLSVHFGYEFWDLICHNEAVVSAGFPCNQSNLVNIIVVANCPYTRGILKLYHNLILNKSIILFLLLQNLAFFKSLRPYLVFNPIFFSFKLFCIGFLYY